MIKINQTYVFQCPASFGTLSQEEVNTLYTDGRVASKFLELQLVKWFPSLVFKDGKGYDHISFEFTNRLDAKSFTKYGAKFSPSKMLGVGRSVDKEELWEHAMNMIYIFCDVVEFPEVRVVFKHGSDLTQYPTGSIPFKDRHVLFA